MTIAIASNLQERLINTYCNFKILYLDQIVFAYLLQLTIERNKFSGTVLVENKPINYNII